jgi:hypothetical protein
MNQFFNYSFLMGLNYSEVSMKLKMNISGHTHVFEISGERLSLIFDPPIKFGDKNNPVNVNIPGVFIVTRGNGAPLFALEPINATENLRTVTAEQLYRRKIQWFEPSADNYRKLIWINPDVDISGSDSARAFKHFQWSEIIDFSIIDRLSISFSSRLSGDWKASDRGGSGYLLVLVDGEPYWADAIGQIPFAVDTFRGALEKSGDPESAIAKTVDTGIAYGDGNPLIPSADLTNEYDNYMVLRGALWASENFQLTKNKRTIEGNIGSREIEQTMTIYNFSSHRRLKNFINAEDLAKYGAWLK